MAALPQLITVEQFRALPERGAYVYELHHGEVVAITQPRPVHYILQRGLSRLLENKLPRFGEVFIELPFRAIPEFDLRVADIGVISRSRFQTLDRNADLAGAPELVIEVISPSNLKPKLRETVSLCLNNGALECWLIDPVKRSINVIRKDGSTSLYEGNADIPLAAFGSDTLHLADISQSKASAKSRAPADPTTRRAIECDERYALQPVSPRRVRRPARRCFLRRRFRPGP